MRLKKVAAICMATSMAMGCLAGCGGDSGSDTTKGSDTANTENQETQSIELTVWAPQEDQAASDEYPDGMIERW